MPYRLTKSGAIVDASGNVAYEACALEDLSHKARVRIVQLENDAEHHGLEIEFEKHILPVLIREGLDAEAARPAPAGANEKEQCNERS